jgi:Ca2+-binding RTX toxin-like protein
MSSLVISNEAGVDLSGLSDASQAFVATGATITGGAGDDVLIGGAGADSIATGRGNNTVLGSLGADQVTLIAGPASDTLVFTAQDQSSFGAGHDSVQFFASTDRIDISSFAHVGFVGNFADNALGLAALLTTEASAFYNTETKTLYIDLDHDQVLTAEADMEIVLNSLTSFSSAILI